MQSHAQPVLDAGPAGLPVVYAIPAGGFDIVVNGDHLLSWGIEAVELQDAALRNLAAWAATAPWTDEVSGERRSDQLRHGRRPRCGPDPAARRRRPPRARSSGRDGARVLVGIPERHLLTAASLRPDDQGFAAMFAEFIVEQSGGADEPIDRRVFEIVDGRLVEFSRMTDGLRVEVDGPVATLTLDRPEALNALTVAVKVALRAALERIAADRAVRAVILTGAGSRVLCRPGPGGAGATRRRAAR